MGRCSVRSLVRNAQTAFVSLKHICPPSPRMRDEFEAAYHDARGKCGIVRNGYTQESKYTSDTAACKSAAVLQITMESSH